MIYKHSLSCFIATYSMVLLLHQPIKSQSIIAGNVATTDTYTDIPDVTLYHQNVPLIYVPNGYYQEDFLEIDIDNNGIKDFKLASGHYYSAGGGGGSGMSSSAGFIQSLQPNAYILYDTTTNYWGYPSGGIIKAAIKYNLGETIQTGTKLIQNKANFWSNRDGISGYSYDGWNVVGDSYVGVALAYPQDTVYGWIRVSVSNETLIVKDFAVFYTPLTIHAIQSDLNFSIYPNPSQDYITIESPLVEKELDYTIMDLQGKVFQTASINDKSLLIDISMLSAGSYFVIVSNEQYRGYHQFIKK